VGLRHRDLTPSTITVRSADPLDLVIEGFGSACLSEFDLDVVSPLETNVYMAPEAVAGGVAEASDWWSFGMILLEICEPSFFEDVDDKALLIQVLTAGVQLPSSLDKRMSNLISGLLIRERDSRFGYEEVAQWLDGEIVPDPIEDHFEEDFFGETIDLGNEEIRSVMVYALRSASDANWEEALGHLLSGRLGTWAEDVGLNLSAASSLRALKRREISEDFKLGIALKIMNENMPLVQRGEIVNPGWLLDNPKEGYELITSDTALALEDFSMEPWIWRLRERLGIVRSRAEAHQIELDEEQLRINALSTSRTRMLALWEERRLLFPDTEHAGLAGIVERKQRTEEDLIILLSADITQFVSVEEVVENSMLEADRAGLIGLTGNFFRDLVTGKTRRELFREIGERTADFARCGVDTIDAWVDQFRLERRTQLPRALVILAIEPDEWRQPDDQVYVANILRYYAAKVETQIKQGPLARMKISKSSDRIDMTELNEADLPAAALVNKILERAETMQQLTQSRIRMDMEFSGRLRKLMSKTRLYKRDTGIDGLYLGFPFLVMTLPTRGTRPRIAPVLLWPVKLSGDPGSSSFRLGFDGDREEVRINPALEGYLGHEEFVRWQTAADELLTGSVTIASAMDEFGRFGTPMADELQRLPSDSVEPNTGEKQV
ncbi:MAG: DUF4011 domain-containing protein, partial [Haliea sp.]